MEKCAHCGKELNIVFYSKKGKSICMECYEKENRE
jgi:hypothetical protein